MNDKIVRHSSNEEEIEINSDLARQADKELRIMADERINKFAREASEEALRQLGLHDELNVVKH